LISTFKKYKHLWIILASWIILGNIFQPLAYVAVLLSVLLFFKKDRGVELFIGFLFILLLSDHVHWGGGDPTKFAKDLKGIYLLIIGFYLWRKRREMDLSNPIFKTFFIFFIWAFLALIWAINPVIGLQKTISFTLIYLLVPIAFINLYKVKGDKFIRVLISYFALVLVLGIAFKYIMPGVVQLESGRFRGLLGNPNGLGLILVQFFMLFYIINSYGMGKLTEWEKRFIYILILASLFLSGSRNGMISIPLFYILIRVFRIHFMIGVFFLVIGFYIYNAIEIDPVMLIRQFGVEDYFRIDTIETGSGRFIAWDFAWKKIQDYYFMGGGFGQDEQVMRPYYDVLSRLGHQGGVHSSYLSLWFDVGLIGIILYFTGLITLIWRAAKKSNLAFPFFFALLFNITYESWLVASLNPFTVLFLMSLTLLVMKYKFVPNKSSNIKKQELNDA